VPDNINIAAIIIAMKAAWEGKAFNKVVSKPLLNQKNAAIACGHATVEMAKS
jgi:hypothetical protein